MLPRQKDLFKNIVQEHIKTAQPVGSKLIVDKYHIDVSSATVRNDMAELEDQGLIFQPHTSAGRIPTEYGYKYFVENYVDLSAKPDEKSSKVLKDVEDEIKKTAKIMAEKSDLLVFVAFDKNNFYYTGLSNLFSQPEFKDLNLVYNLSDVIDHLDDVISRIYNDIDDVQIKIGKDNPFSTVCSTVLAKIKNNLIGIVGPMRMNYQNNVKLIASLKNI